jgi:NAD(P)-dependent dehydrogenase (short-subunit alcohol dehydrogenase family)
MNNSPNRSSLADQGVVITGAGSGIGRALAHAFSAAGARVVVNDLDVRSCHAAAEEVGAIACPGDAATSDGVSHLVHQARSELGRIDIFCANAGIEGGRGLEATDAQWERSLEVNTLSHVRAARLLVPQWLEVGKGRFIVTASAAGLLSMLGSAPYAVSKHAAVAFAEWMSMTYRHRGIITQALCPQWVETPMLSGVQEIAAVIDSDRVLTPEYVAQCVVTACEGDSFYILPHPEVADYYRARATDPDQWLAIMNGLQRKIEAADETAH